MQVKLLLDLIQIILRRLRIYFLKRFRRLIVEDDEIAIADVKARQMIARVFRVENVLEDDERGAARLGRIADANLSDRAVLAEDVVHLLARDLVGQIAYVENPIDFGR